MKASVLARRLALVLTLASTALSLPVRADDNVSLNFANAEIGSVIDAIGKISGKNFLVDPRVKGTLNIVTNTPVSRDLSYQILLSALRLQGYTAVEGPGVTKIVPEADAKLHGVPVGRGEQTVGGDKLITQVFPMRHESAAQMLAVVRPLVSPNNTVTAFPSNNVLVVTDYADNLSRIARIIESIDVPQGDVTVAKLEYAIAVDLADTINRLMNEGGGPAAAGGGGDGLRVQVIAEPRTNSLLIRSENPARIRAVRRLIASLDQPGAGGNIHVVYLRNAEAVKVAQTLNAALSGDHSALSSLGTTGLGGSGSNTGSLGSSSGMQQDGRSATNLGSASGSTSSGQSSGIVQADAVNNALIIVAPEATYRNLRHVIDKLDRRRAQVYIEALIAEVSSDRAAEFGIQWQTANLGETGTQLLGGTNFGGNGQNIIGAAANIASVGKGMNLMIGKGTVKVPIGGEMVEIFNLSLLARFLESDSRTNILSTPTLVTLDNEEAKIVVGRNLPFVTGQYTSTGSGSTPENPFQTIERRDVGLTLEVRPQISEGGTIKLDIYQEASSVVPTVDESRGPTTKTRSIKSTVLVDNGAIIALGGLVEDSFTSGEEKVPLLGDIPVAGNLFRYRNRQRSKTNLVVFLRPVILRDQDSYTDLTRSRYDYVIGQQHDVVDSVTMLRNEPPAPTLPPAAIGASATQGARPLEAADLMDRADAPAPVEDARIALVVEGRIVQ
ncbi:MAG: type II secretion system secretin GspD [Rhodocyclaceae bacterium]|jgi:general secretion pathway protein D|nr:type II secretion system secretin GspD [Rhodocyclaceae bacterium]